MKFVYQFEDNHTTTIPINLIVEAKQIGDYIVLTKGVGDAQLETIFLPYSEVAKAYDDLVKFKFAWEKFYTEASAQKEESQAGFMVAD